jgi:hypothetical protein
MTTGSEVGAFELRSKSVNIICPLSCNKMSIRRCFSNGKHKNVSKNQCTTYFLALNLDRQTPSNAGTLGRPSPQPHKTGLLLPLGIYPDVIEVL